MKQITDKHTKAFLNIARILVPIEYDSVEEKKTYKPSGYIDIDYVARGTTDDGYNVTIQTSQHPTKGKQIDIIYDNGVEIVSSRSIWLFSFNWVGLGQIDDPMH